MTADPPPAVLIELVERFQGGWEMLPENSRFQEVESRIGFTLKLSARHDSPVDHPATNCVHCHNVFLFLHVSADWLFPRQKRGLMFEPEVQFPSRIDSPWRQTSSDVRLVIRVAHREAWNEAEECVERWRKELEQSLTAHGVRPLEQLCALETKGP